jgi:hypothetical protein
MNEYGVVQLGEYLVSFPGAVLYLASTFLGMALAWGLAINSETSRFKLVKFVVFGALIVLAVTLLWIQVGVWFYVKA